MVKSLLTVVESAVVAALFFLAFAFGLSPLYHTFGWDNATFLYIGKAIAYGGLTPYVDISDNKGILFLMIQAFGQTLSPDRWGGVWVFFPALWASVYLMYRIALMRLSLSSARWAVSIVLLFYAVSLGDGNLTEDFALPVSLFCMYLFLKQSKWGSEPVNSYGLPVVLGLGIGLTALLRLNNCALVIPWTIYPFLLKEGKPIRWSVALLIGFLLAILPVFFLCDSEVLIRFWEDTVAYNWNYVESGGGDWSYWNAISLLFLVLNLLLMFRNREIRNNRSLLILMFAAHVIGFGVANMSKRYSHYQTLVIPLILFGCLLLTSEINTFVRSKAVQRRFYRITTVGVCLILVLLFARKAIFYRSIDELSPDPVTEKLKTVIPIHERGRVALYNLPIHYAYKADLYTTNPYCFSSVQMTSVSYPEYEDAIKQALLSEQTLWLVTPVTPDFTLSISAVVAEEYIPIEECGGIVIRQRKQK